jgi:bifunctional DNA-binding transcriptional regulator/antitoxin component of YhaV-PrlF toxin-antitoxin module
MRDMSLGTITSGGQLSIPARVRRRWGTRRVVLDDRGDYLVVKPLPDDPVSALRGLWKGQGLSSEELRAIARRDEAAAESRRR